MTNTNERANPMNDVNEKYNMLCHVRGMIAQTARKLVEDSTDPELITEMRGLLVAESVARHQFEEATKELPY